MAGNTTFAAVEPIKPGATIPRIVVPSATIPAPAKTLFIVLLVFNLKATYNQP